MYLIVGATGLLGREIGRRLAEEGKPVKALIRATSDPTTVDMLKQSGIRLVTGDLKDRSSLDAACQDITTVISTASATLSRQDGDTIETVDQEGQIQLIEAAKAAGVERFIFISMRTGANPTLEYPLKAAKRSVEHHLIESGLTYTILQPSYFMEVWLSPALGFDYTNATARIFGTGQNPISWISYTDVARYTLAALDNGAGHNAILEFGGPEALSPLEVVKIFEDTSDRPFAVEHVPEEALQAQKAAATETLGETFAALMLQYATGDVVDAAARLKALPVQPSSIQDYAARVLNAS